MLSTHHNHINEIEIDDKVYRNVKQLGRGGFGEVFLFQKEASDPEEGENIQVAVKFLFNDKDSDPDSEVTNWQKAGYQSQKLSLNNSPTHAIVMPYFGDTTMMAALKTFIQHQTENISERSESLIVKEVLKAFLCLIEEIKRFYDKGLVHTDGYMDNIIYNGKKALYIDLDKVLTTTDLQTQDYLYTDIIAALRSVETINELIKANLAQDAPNALDDFIALATACLDQYKDKSKLLSALKRHASDLLMPSKPNYRMGFYAKRADVETKEMATQSKCIAS